MCCSKKNLRVAHLTRLGYLFKLQRRKKYFLPNVNGIPYNLSVLSFNFLYSQIDSIKLPLRSSVRNRTPEFQISPVASSPHFRRWIHRVVDFYVTTGTSVRRGRGTLLILTPMVMQRIVTRPFREHCKIHSIGRFGESSN